MAEQDLYTVIGARIREERVRRDMTLEDLAYEVGIDAPRLSRFERGERGIDTVVLRRIARLFGMPVDAFFEPAEPAGVLALARRGDADDESMREMVDWALGLRANMAFVEREHEALRG
jgi:transcriptional regulator with XRE-family HTH domain